MSQLLSQKFFDLYLLDIMDDKRLFFALIIYRGKKISPYIIRTFYLTGKNNKTKELACKNILVTLLVTVCVTAKKGS